MSPTNDAAARRAEARQERRARHASKGDTDAAQSEEEPDKVGTALRGAAAAAALGAALGAARALATRDDESEDAPEPADVADEAPEPEREPEDSAPEPEDETPEPTLEAQRQPARDARPEADEQPEGASRATVRSIVGKAREQFGELHGTEPESLSALERLGSGGWRVTFEVVEVERVPSSTDLLATYVLELDDDAQLTTYERVRRYYRAQADLGDER